MTMFLLLMLAAMGAVVSYISLRSDKFRVARSIIIDAPPEAVYPHLTDFHAWENWSPLSRFDADVERSHEGPPLGAGAVFSWTGDPRQGSGAMKILTCSPDERVIIRRRLTRPFEMSDEFRFDLTPVGQGTEVVWQASGRLDFMGKSANLFAGLERKLGGQFEQGLKNLKSLVETKGR